MNRLFNWLLLLTVFLSLSYILHADEKITKNEIRAIWVTRWDYKNPYDIKQIVQNAKKHHFNMILFQVRGNGTVSYPSKLEPWGREFGGINPGWNPLTEAITSAHQEGIQLHAWVNVLTGWSGTNSPKDQKQLYNAHPEWFMVDEDQQSTPLNSHYVWLNPILPEFQKHLYEVVVELSKIVDLDGIHFDYFRFPGPGFSYDDRSIQLFKDKYNVAPKDSSEMWNNFRRDAITNWLKKVYEDVKRENPELVFSSAVIGDYDNGPNLYLQDSQNWLRKGIIDIIFPMIYTEDIRMFERWINRYSQFDYGRFICPGLMIYENSTTLQDQINSVRQFNFPGISLFAYSLLFPEHKPNKMANDIQVSLFTEKTSLPEFPKSINQKQISEVHWFPKNPTTKDSIQIVCKVIGIESDNSYEVFGTWKGKTSSATSYKIEFQQISKKPEYWFSKTKILPKQNENDYKLQIYAKLDNDYLEISSEEYQIIFDTPAEYFQPKGQIGPLMTRAIKAIVGYDHSIWIYEPEVGLHNILQYGTEAAFSPITTFRDDRGKEQSFSGLSGMVTLPDSTIEILIIKNGKTYTLENKNNKRVFKVSHKLPMPGMDFSVDEKGFYYLLQKKGWYKTNQHGHIISRIFYEKVHTPNNIAVSPNGEFVLLACRTEGIVHSWQREENQITYKRISDLGTHNVGMGGITCDKNGNIYLAATPRNFVKVWNQNFELVDLLLGGKPSIHGPRLAIPSPYGDLVYIIAIGATTPVRMTKWQKIRAF